MERDNHLTTLLKLQKEYDIYVELKMTSVQGGWHSLLHLTIDGNIQNYGSRIPGIFCYNSRVYNCSAVSGNRNYCNNVAVQKDLWVDIKISQKRKVSDFWYVLSVGGKELANVKNTKPQEFSNVKVYAGDPWHPPMSGYIRDLYIGVKI